MFIQVLTAGSVQFKFKTVIANFIGGAFQAPCEEKNILLNN